MNLSKGWKLVIAIIIPFLASTIASLFTTSSISTWYTELIKPSFNPPSWVFAPVWTILYLLMGISLYLIWTTKPQKKALTVFGIQLFLNVSWPILFFSLKSPLLAFIEIIALWISIIVTIILFYRINKKAAYLLIPYMLWVTFAAVLNLSLYLLN